MVDDPRQTTLDCLDEMATFSLGRHLAAVVGELTTIALQGDFGAGKTVFSRGFARGSGIVEPVTSPTFTVVQEYARPDGMWLYHLDMYRIPDEAAAVAFGIEDFLFPENAICLVEWPERIAGLLIPDADARLIAVRIEHAGGDRRAITLPAEWAAAVEHHGGDGQRPRLQVCDV